jgi:hypothetical protein
MELHLAHEPAGVIGEQDLLTRPDHDGDRLRQFGLLLHLEDELLPVEIWPGGCQRVRRGELAAELVDHRP